MFKVVTPAHCSDDLLKKYVDLDQSAFDPDGAITWERAKMVEKLNPGNVSFVYDGEEIAAVISLLSIRKSAVEYAKQINKPIYKILDEKTLDPTGEDQILYIHNVIVAPEYQGQGISNELLDVLRDRVNKMPELKEVWADAVSPGGKRFLEKAGLDLMYTFPDGALLCYEDGNELKETLNKRK